ncbi:MULTISPECIES: hypothetical protein [Arthrobacter]|uniref:Alpha-tubulin suppressor n=2 Tax=Arthrobacter TaxID=1663 RepID=A0ABU9KP96_9MICC|nr:hypothetical protein [Arthrobacter sp. YJM1]MDP5228626.1 hypothetical protein [Arthrobacter sp. YJM1]
MSTSSIAGPPRTARLVACLGAALLALTAACVPGTSAGFTDSTFGQAALTTAAGLDSPPTDYDQSAASSLFISARGELYITGFRGNGDGNGQRPAGTAAPSRVSFPEGTVIVDAAGSTNDFSTVYDWTNSYMALDSRGQVWTWGAVYGGALGRHGYGLIGRGGISAEQSRTVGRVTTTADGTPLPHIRSIARSENQFLALDGSGQLWAWGYGGENLPRPAGPGVDAALPFRVDLTTWAPSLTRCDGGGGNNLGRVLWHSVWGGNNAAGAVGQNGLIYSWGFDNMQPPGSGNGITSTTCPSINERANRVLFQEYPELYRTVDGLVYDESLLRSETERHARFSAIVNARLQAGVLEQCSSVKGVGKTDESGCPVRQLAFPARATLLLTQNGKLQTWKASTLNYGDPFLGRSPGSNPHWPTTVSVAGTPLTIRSFSPGISSVQALTTEGRVLGWGWNNYCQAIGRPTGKPDCNAARNTPTAATDLVSSATPVAGIPVEDKVTRISTTQCAAWATTESGRLYAWGAGTVAGTDFRTCKEPASAQKGYKIYDYDSVDQANPFGRPVTGRATETRKVAGE